MAKTAAKSSRDGATKNPKGGLTAAGRAKFKKSEGANLKPGVKTVKTDEDARRKGSFLRRFYGRKKMSPLVDKNGKPTRFALAAHAWGEPVPKTEAAVRKLAKKGETLLARHAKTAASKSKAKKKA